MSPPSVDLITCGGKMLPDAIGDNLFPLYCPQYDKHVAQVFLH